MRKSKLWCYVLTASLILGGLICLPNGSSLLYASNSYAEREVLRNRWDILEEDSGSNREILEPMTTTARPSYSTPTPTGEVLRTLSKPTSTPKPTQTPTSKPTSTPKSTQTPTSKPTSTPKPTQTPTSKPTSTPKSTPKSTPTTTPKPTSTPTTPKSTSTPKPTSTPTSTPKLTPTSTPTSAPKPSITSTPAKFITPTTTQLVTPSPTTSSGPTSKIVPTQKVTDGNVPKNTSGDLDSNPDNSQEIIEENEEVPNSTQQIVQRFYIGVKYYYINDVKNEMDLAPIIKDGRTLLPIRYVSETFGAKVDWNGKEEKVTISFGEQIVELWIGKDAAIVGGKLKRLDVVPEIIEGRTVLPLRFVSENLGLKVAWDGDLKEVKITN